MSRIDTFLELLVKQDGSDLHLVSGNAPRIRMYGELIAVKYRELSANETMASQSVGRLIEAMQEVASTFL